MPPGSTNRIGALAALVDAALQGAGPGPQRIDLPCVWSVASGQFTATVVRAHGFLPVFAAAPPAHEDPRWLHRHIALLVTCAGRAWAAGLVKRLARASPRSHAVMVFAGAGATRPWQGQFCGDADDDDARLARWIGEGRFDAAEAWLAALRLEARLLERPCRRRTIELGVCLRLWQARHEEAAALSLLIPVDRSRRAFLQFVRWASCERRPLPPRPVVQFWTRTWGNQFLALFDEGTLCAGRARTRAGWPAAHDRTPASTPHFPRLIHGATVMHLLPAVPTLLQRLTDADDELVALRLATAWCRQNAGATGVAFVGGVNAVVLASSGPSGSSFPAADRLQATTSVEPAVTTRGALALATAPVRYAGGYAGAVLVSGPVDRRETLLEAATMVAMLCAPAVRTRIDALAGAQKSGERLPEIVGQSPSAAGLRDDVVRAAATPFAVLVEGESGTGKELVARALHRLSERRDRRFVAVNCAALSDELIEAELFGHARGAFTGAVSQRTGLFEDAHGGSLFLDEVAELSPRAQAKLLRVLQEREVRRVGENAARPVNVRIIAATNRPLSEASAAGHFRQDLLFRLAVVRIRLSPLRERAEDIAPIARAFWTRTVHEVGKRAVIGADALARLAVHGWPGNVRELQNVIAGLAVIAPERGRVSARHVELVLASAGTGLRLPPMSLDRARRICERQTVTAALARHAGRRGAAARELGLTRQGLSKVMRRLQLNEPTIEGVA